MATRDAVENLPFKDDLVRWMGLDMTKTFIIQLSIPFNCFEDEYTKRSLFIAMGGTQYIEQLIHKLGPKSKRLELQLSVRVP